MTTRVSLSLTGTSPIVKEYDTKPECDVTPTAATRSAVASRWPPARWTGRRGRPLGMVPAYVKYS